MKIIIQLTIALVLLSPNIDAYSQHESKSQGESEWWNAGWPKWPEKNPFARNLPLISVRENKFVNSSGDTMMFRGLAIADPDKLDDQGHWSKAHFEKIKEMGANIVRIPVHPIAWRERTPEKYLQLLDQAVQWCTELEMYVIIDWHSIGNLHMELFQNEMYNTTQKETYEFWRAIAWHFKGHNTVAFYELFNEPTSFFGHLGTMTWTQWKDIIENIISLIRACDKETIPLVAGLDWGYDLGFIRYEPVNAEGIGYVSHPYAAKRKPPWPPKWEENFGFAADSYPVIVTEFGFRLAEGDTIDEGHYGNIIISYLEEKGINWIAWVFDPDWHPHIFSSWETYELSGSGKFFKEQLKRNLKD
jgi:endoglucanase